MPITNRNIGADAAIDPSKLNHVSSARLWHEDFEETGDVDALYGIQVFDAGSSETHAMDGAGNVFLDCQANNDALLLRSTSTWNGLRHPKVSCRMAMETVTIGELSNVQVGFADTVASAASATPITDQDWAYLEFNIANSPNWRLRTRITGAAIVTVDSGIAATTSQTDLSVKLINGLVVATIDGHTFRSAAGAVTADKTDWHWIVRVESDDGGDDDQSLTVDSISCNEARTDFTT
jgi:hypothetical protein